MKIAALILAYKYPLGLQALERYFSTINVDIFVHVDAKIDPVLFIKFGGPKITFIANRKRIFWGGFTMVEATVELMRISMIKNYDRYIIISDDSLPIIKMRDFRNKIEVDGDYIDPGIALAKFEYRYKNFYMHDSEATQIQWLPTVERGFTEDALARIGRMKSLLEIGKKPIRALFHGSQWMSLTAESVHQIVNSFAKDCWLRESFEFSDVPDEHYFQTI